MMRALWTAGSGMIAQQLNVDTIANNLANVNTTGFKKSRMDFQDLMYQTLKEPGATSGPDNMLPTGIQIGLGVKPVASQKIFTEGSFQQTGNPLDVAIEGDGFFQVLLPDGTTAYTRDGSFKKDAQGRIVTSDGYPVEPNIVIPDNAMSVNISADGRVSVKLPNQAEDQEIGQFELVRFVNPAGLSSIGRNLYQETAASGPPNPGTAGQDGFGTIVSQYLEMSNVQVVEEMVNMIVAQRAYEVNSKAITTADEMLQQANNLKR